MLPKLPLTYTSQPYSVFTAALLEAFAGYGAFERDGYAQAGLARAVSGCSNGIFFFEQTPAGDWLPAYQVADQGSPVDQPIIAWPVAY